MSDASFDAMANFLSLGLSNYAVDLTPDDSEYTVYEALYNLATKPLPPGDDTTLGSEEGSLLAKWWDYVAFAPPKKTKDPSGNPVVWKEAKDLNNFIRCARRCDNQASIRHQKGAWQRPPVTHSHECSCDGQGGG